MTEHEGYFLAAYAVDAVDLSRARVEWIIVHRATNGDWHDNDGNRILAFYTEPIATPQPSIPEGWLDYVHAEAQKMAKARFENMRPTGLAALLNARPKAEATPTTPIPRRGF